MRTWSGLVKACVGGAMMLGAVGLSPRIRRGLRQRRRRQRQRRRGRPPGQRSELLRLPQRRRGRRRLVRHRGARLRHRLRVRLRSTSRRTASAPQASSSCTDSTGADVARRRDAACTPNGAATTRRARPASPPRAPPPAPRRASSARTPARTCASGNELIDQCQCVGNEQGALAFELRHADLPGLRRRHRASSTRPADAGPADAKTGG